MNTINQPDGNVILENKLHQANVGSNFQERSEITQEIISRKPGFTERWALFIFFIIVLILTVSTWFIRYPEIIEATAILTGENAPKEIVAKQTGRLTGLFVKNNQEVDKGQVLGWIESTASAQEVLRLSDNLDSSMSLLAIEDFDKISSLFKRQLNHLGELQLSYQSFINAWQEFNDYLVNGFFAKKKSLLFKDLQSLESMKGNAVKQLDLAFKDNALAQKSFEMKEYLYKEKIISLEEFRQAESQYTNKLTSIPQLETALMSYETRKRETLRQIEQLDHDVFQQRKTFEQALQTLKSNVDEWLAKYIIQAPIQGTIVFVLPLQKNQFIDQGKLMALVNVPDTKYYAELKLAQNNFGKVDTGMKVQLRFDAYPYQEIGFVAGRLDYLSNVAIDSGFLGTVRLSDGLNTSQKRKIEYKSGLKARAIIITKDMRLLQRLYYNITESLNFH